MQSRVAFKNTMATLATAIAAMSRRVHLVRTNMAAAAQARRAVERFSNDEQAPTIDMACPPTRLNRRAGPDNFRIRQHQQPADKRRIGAEEFWRQKQKHDRPHAK